MCYKNRCAVDWRFLSGLARHGWPGSAGAKEGRGRGDRGDRADRAMGMGMGMG